jgi:hypothetical protein
MRLSSSTKKSKGKWTCTGPLSLARILSPDLTLAPKFYVTLFATATFGHAYAAEHLGRGLELHRRNDREEAEHHQGEDDELFHG